MSNTTQHTPGPWAIGPSPKTYTAIMCNDSVRPRIANVMHITTGYHTGDISDVSPDPESRANARLIAAAPDYYDAGLEAEYALLGAIGVMGEIANLKLALEKLQRARAKAEGGI